MMDCLSFVLFCFVLFCFVLFLFKMKRGVGYLVIFYNYVRTKKLKMRALFLFLSGILLDMVQ